MPETGRLLRFPSTWRAEELSHEGARAMAEEMLELPESERSQELVDQALSHVDVVLSACALLRDRINETPAVVATEASALYSQLSGRTGRLGLFDERHFVMGELAWLAGNGCRLAGRRDEAERWFDRADANFRHTVNPAPLLSRVSFARLSLRYDMRLFEEVLELLPSLVLSFENLGMRVDLAKARYLQALTLKETGSRSAALSSMMQITADGSLQSEPGFLGMAFVNLGDLWAQEDEFDQALQSYNTALGLLRGAKHGYAIAHLKGSVGDTLRRQGNYGAAIEAFREGVSEYVALGMATWAAYTRLALAQTLLEFGRPREAEWEILAALPTIDEQKMVPEGVAAIRLLRESVRQRNTDPKALLELREYLQAKN